jgi:cell division protein FtsB
VAFRVLIRFRVGKRRPPTRGSDSGPVSDAQPAGVRREPRQSGPDPESERHQRIRDRLLLMLMVLVFVGGSAAALFGERGFFDLRRSRVEQQELQRQVDEQLGRVLALKEEVGRLKEDPTAIERIAREDLGYIRHGEIHFLLPRDSSGLPGIDDPAPTEGGGAATR